jgi:hypothetical protein
MGLLRQRIARWDPGFPHFAVLWGVKLYIHTDGKANVLIYSPEINAHALKSDRSEGVRAQDSV